MKVIGYSRVSTTKQELYRQRDKISKFCDEKHFFLNRIILRTLVNLVLPMKEVDINSY